MGPFKQDFVNSNGGLEMYVEVGDIIEYYFERQKFPRTQGVTQHEGQGKVIEMFNDIDPPFKRKFLVQSQGLSTFFVYPSEILSVVSRG